MFTYLGNASTPAREGATIRLPAGDEQVSVTFCTSRIVRVRLEYAGSDPGLSYVEPRAWPEPPLEIRSGELLRVTSSDLAVQIATQPLRLSFEDPKLGVVLSEPISGGMGTEPAGDGSDRRRVTARFQFADEQHFY